MSFQLKKQTNQTNQTNKPNKQNPNSLSLQMNFTEAAEKAKSLPSSMPDEKKLELYGLYKQATVGDNTTDQPWMVQVEARAKWDSWAKHKGMSKDDAEKAYVALVEELAKVYA